MIKPIKKYCFTLYYVRSDLSVGGIKQGWYLRQDGVDSRGVGPLKESAHGVSLVNSFIRCMQQSHNDFELVGIMLNKQTGSIWTTRSVV